MNNVYQLNAGQRGDEQRAPKKGLFKRAGVRYEVACDVIGALIAHYSEVVATELDKESPDQGVIEHAEAAKKALRDHREALSPSDVAAVEQAIASYGPQARALFQ